MNLVSTRRRYRVLASAAVLSLLGLGAAMSPAASADAVENGGVGGVVASGAGRGTPEFGRSRWLTPHSPGDYRIIAPSVSGDGSVVAFYSDRSDLVTPDERGTYDVLIYAGGRLTTPYPSGLMRQDLGENASLGGVSRDGRYVLFSSNSPRLLPTSTTVGNVYVYDRTTGNLELISVTPSGEPAATEAEAEAISADGRYIVFNTEAALVPEDTNGRFDVYVRDRVAGTTAVVSVPDAGMPRRQGNGRSRTAAISGDGRYVAFASEANNLVPGDTNKIADAFIRDRVTGLTERVSVDSDGQQSTPNPFWGRANTTTYVTGVSDDGRRVLFDSEANGIGSVRGDQDQNVFLRDREAGTTTLLSQKDGHPSGQARAGRITPDGKVVTFTSYSTLLQPQGETNGTWTFLWDVPGRRMTPIPEQATGGQLTTNARKVCYAFTNGRYQEGAVCRSVTWRLPRTEPWTS